MSYLEPNCHPGTRHGIGPESPGPSSAVDFGTSIYQMIVIMIMMVAAIVIRLLTKTTKNIQTTATTDAAIDDANPQCVT